MLFSFACKWILSALLALKFYDSKFKGRPTMLMKLVLLKLFLDELGVGSDIDTFDERKTIQKAVYLGQLADVDMGYRFGWYLKGPYSPALAEDYYHLADELEMGERGYEEYQLNKSLKNKLEKVRSLFEKPQDVTLEKKDWLELVASCDYLRRVRKLSDDKVNEVLQKEKGDLFAFKDLALRKLSGAPLKSVKQYQ